MGASGGNTAARVGVRDAPARGRKMRSDHFVAAALWFGLATTPAWSQEGVGTTAAEVEAMSQQAASFRRIIASLEDEAEAAEEALSATSRELEAARTELAEVEARVSAMEMREAEVSDELREDIAGREAQRGTLQNEVEAAQAELDRLAAASGGSPRRGGGGGGVSRRGAGGGRASFAANSALCVARSATPPRDRPAQTPKRQMWISRAFGRSATLRAKSWNSSAKRPTRRPRRLTKPRRPNKRSAKLGNSRRRSPRRPKPQRQQGAKPSPWPRPRVRTFRTCNPE